MFYLLRRNIVGCRSHVDLLVNIQARDDEEHSRTPGTALYQSPQSEDDGPLVLLRFKGNANIRSPSKEKVLLSMLFFTFLVFTTKLTLPSLIGQIMAHLDDLHHPEETDRESHQDEDDGEEGQHVSEHSRALLAGSLVPCSASQFFCQENKLLFRFFLQ